MCTHSQSSGSQLFFLWTHWTSPFSPTIRSMFTRWIVNDNRWNRSSTVHCNSNTTMNWIAERCSFHVPISLWCIRLGTFMEWKECETHLDTVAVVFLGIISNALVPFRISLNHVPDQNVLSWTQHYFRQTPYTGLPTSSLWTVSLY